MMSKMIKKLVSTHYLFLIFLFLLPILVLPIAVSAVAQTKLLLIFLLAILTSLIYLIKNIKNKKISLVAHPLVLPFLILIILLPISSLLNANYEVHSLFDLIGVFLNLNRFLAEDFFDLGGVILSFSLIIILAPSILKIYDIKNFINKIIYLLAASASLITLSSILQLLGTGPSRLLNLVPALNFPHNLLFNLTGSSLLAIQVLILSLIGLAGLIINKNKNKLLNLILIIIIILGLGLHIWSLLPSQNTPVATLPADVSWAISVENLKNIKTALVGVGPSKYLNAFNFYKPQWFNASQYWRLQFSQGFNWPLTLITSMGLLGLMAWLYIIFKIFIKILKNKNNNQALWPLSAVLIANIILQFVFAPSFTLLGLQAILLSLWLSCQSENYQIINLKFFSAKGRPASGWSRQINIILNLALIILVLIAGFFVFKNLAAKTLLMLANSAAKEQKVSQAYGLQQLAIKFSPYLDSNRRIFANSNLKIAAALSQKTDLNETESAQMLKLIQEAIKEAKAATILDPMDSNNWQNLGQIYDSLVDVTPDAQAFAVKAYVNAIDTAPTNPNLRIRLGGLLYNNQEYQEALKFFEQAIELKPDLANAYYNAANALRELGKIEEAKKAYQEVLLLIPADSEDYIKAAKELNQL